MLKLQPMRMVVALILALEVISALGLAHVSGSVSSGLLMTLHFHVWTFIRMRSEYEALGQIALVHCLSAVTPGGRLFVRVPSWCDNTGAESVNDKLFTSDWPLAAFVQRLAVYSVETGVELDVSPFSGEKNTPADSLSRWASGMLEDLPCSCQLSFRIPIDLQSFWKHERRARVYPADAYVPWTLPARTFDF